ncbi:hypothetical protein HPB52_013047 [Rhipicephalus sanguineus]|uniref:Uncharacterized protein n=1 Tax=Rhipicephalus sanguineus TaxID=34632 RepID=A0A9D4T601_RHISA|nr:hypothetical protein HPB52_013047 [Rhipicephalus sanguineus]
MINSVASTSVMTVSNEKPLREVIREILREELRQLGLIPPEPAPALSFVADVVRDEVRAGSFIARLL